MLSACAAAAAAARTLDAGPGQEHADLASALRVAEAGNAMRIAASTHYACAVVAQDRLVLEGAGPDRTVLAGNRLDLGAHLASTDGAWSYRARRFARGLLADEPLAARAYTPLGRRAMALNAGGHGRPIPTFGNRALGVGHYPRLAVGLVLDRQPTPWLVPAG